jgi:hypothetical protein
MAAKANSGIKFELAHSASLWSDCLHEETFWCVTRLCLHLVHQD